MMFDKFYDLYERKHLLYRPVPEAMRDLTRHYLIVAATCLSITLVSLAVTLICLGLILSR